MKLLLPFFGALAALTVQNANAETLRGKLERALTGYPPDTCAGDVEDIIEETGLELANTIMEIQGDGLSSSFVGNTAYRVEGVVTSVRADPSQVFFIQDLHGDGLRRTSDGISVFSDEAVIALAKQGYIGDDPLTRTYDDLRVGDLVVLDVAQVREPVFYDPNQPTTRLWVTRANTKIVARGIALPEPVLIGSNGRLPPTENMKRAVKFWESLKGMLVRVESPLVVAPRLENTINTVTDHGQYATGFSERGVMVVGPQDFNPEIIPIVQLDEQFDTVLPDVSVGAKLDEVVGIVIETNYRRYSIVPVEHFGLVEGTSLEPSTTTCKKGPYSMSVATYDIYTLPDPFNYVDLAEDIVNNLGFPDVLALQYYNPISQAIRPVDLDALNNAIQALPNAPDNRYHVIPSTDGTPILFNPWRISWVDRNDISEGGTLSGPVPLHLAARLKFLPTQEKFDIINVLFYPKLFPDAFTAHPFPVPLMGPNQPFSRLQEVPMVNAGVDMRLAQSNTVRLLIEGDPTATPDPIPPFVVDPAKVIVLGNLNENYFVSPVHNLEGVPLKSLAEDIEYSERYSVIYEQGSAQAWDHIFVGEYLCPGTYGEYIHVNAEFYGESYHDPMLGCVHMPYTH